MRQSRIYGFRAGDTVNTSPEFNKNHAAGSLTGLVVGLYNCDANSDAIYILDDNGSTHTINECNLVPFDDWQARLNEKTE